MPLYGPETKKALKNFPISGWTMPREFLQALAMLKEHAAVVNGELGEIPEGIGQLIAEAAARVKTGEHDEQFPVDVFQTGSGTSTNMNMNEVIAALAMRSSKFEARSSKIHPIDHVNRCQSSNDVIPTALQIACALQLRDSLLPSLRKLEKVLRKKSKEFHSVIKTARTHLMEAVPMRLGHEFCSYVTLLQHATCNVQRSINELCSLPLGGTAAGTGMNAHPEFAVKVIEHLKEETKLPLVEADDHVAAQSFPFAVLSLSSSLRQLACVLQKIANDIRLGAMLEELKLPALQKGSSIMPGKVNPVICESVLQVASWVVGADTAIVHAISMSSTFELCACFPLLTEKLLPSIRVLANVSCVFTDRCVAGIAADRKRISDRMSRNPMLATALAPHIGYESAAKIAKEAVEKGMTVYEVALKRTKIGKEKLQKILNLKLVV